MTKLEKALLVAENVHSGQLYDIFPYIYHVRDVVGVAIELGYDESIQVAAALHDVMEDGALSYSKIKKFFGEEVAEIVYAVTDEKGRNRKEKKRKTYPGIRANWKAAAVKICDRISNLNHSIKYGNMSKIKMYIDEHEEFSKGISCGSHPSDIKNAWLRLEAILLDHV